MDEIYPNEAIALDATEYWARMHNFGTDSEIFTEALKFVLDRADQHLSHSAARQHLKDFEKTATYAKQMRLELLERRALKLEAEAKKARDHYLSMLNS